jgi:ribosomal subunit interface protein
MQTPLQITFRDMPHSDALETHIREKAQKLEQFYPSLIGCRVVVEQVGKHHQHGNPFNIRIDLTVPRAEIVIDRQENEDAYVALRDAFDAAKRRLEDHKQA